MNAEVNVYTASVIIAVACINLTMRRLHE